MPTDLAEPDPNRRAEPRTLSQSLLANFAGVRIRPVDLAAERQRRLEALVWDERDIHADIRRYQRSQWITPEERETQLAEQMEKLRELIRESKELRALVLPGTEGEPTAIDPVAQALTMP